MATRPSPRSSDGVRPRSKSGSGRPPSSPRSSDSSRQTTGRSPTSAASDKPIPSFLRPTVSSSLHSSSSASSLSYSSSSKGPAATARRSADKAPVHPLGAPRPITPKDKAKAPAASTSRWSAVSPRQLMQKASNAIKASSKSRGKKSKEAVSPAASVSGKEGAGASVEAKGETARAQPVGEKHQQPETPAESPPAVQTEGAVLEPKAEQNEQRAATSQEGAHTDITTVEERDQNEQVRAEQPDRESEKEEAVAEKTIPEEAQAVNVETPEPELQEENLQSCPVAETGTEAQKNRDVLD
ncbi:RNA polymerase II degradation factor 1-like [Phragmites australis]|uniref:RNA polymerase II degradation factor 1-like n=1 Tax=Phragmites australis TaxID=29695 RepID=UPI002D77B63E|nr:RNA polymerase II degradation factor 1-like [Phragmites australis]